MVYIYIYIYIYIWECPINCLLFPSKIQKDTAEENTNMSNSFKSQAGWLQLAVVFS